MLDLFSLSGTETALWILFSASSALALSLGAILSYHWFKHSHNMAATVITLGVYSGVCTLLLTTMFGAIVSL